VSTPKKLRRALGILDTHYRHFQQAKPLADMTEHTVPCDTKSWSQILVSVIVDVNGRARGKGSDLSDGSDVKGANFWDAIDSPRFNGVLNQRETGPEYLKSVPHLYFVMWDNDGPSGPPRCRIWVVRTSEDRVFRKMARRWYVGRIRDNKQRTNFQLHPPRDTSDNLFTNKCGNLTYPLLFTAIRNGRRFELTLWKPSTLIKGQCVKEE
jgi:hypothetical protein